MKVVSPTGLGIRGLDDWGSGHYGAPRGNRVHNGTDFICVPGQDVYAPITGKIVRVAYPYAGDLKWSGCLIVGDRTEAKMFYMRLSRHIVGSFVEAGDVIGTAQNISNRYSSPDREPMTPHVHLQIKMMDYINPALYLEEEGA
jgi:murein DD-endopeptidase MepM/ murein hydrolase activator NlpD